MYRGAPYKATHPLVCVLIGVNSAPFPPNFNNFSGMFLINFSEFPHQNFGVCGLIGSHFRTKI